MKILLIPALGVAAVGAAQPAAADVLLSQLMIQGQPGYSGTVNRTLPSGSSGITPLNTPVGPSPYTVAPSPSFTPPVPYIGQRGDLNTTEREYVAPGEPDASGKIGPTIDRVRARFAGERGPDGKILPTHGADQAQATQPSQSSPPTPAPSEMRRSQPPTSLQPGTAPQPRRPGSGEMTGQSGTSSMQESQATTQQQRSGSMQPRAGARKQTEMSETAALNALAAEGYTNVGKIERVGNAWQTTAMKQGKQVTVEIDPQTHRVMER